MLERDMAHPAGSRRRFTCSRSEHLQQPLGLHPESDFHAGVMTQATGMHPLDAEHLLEVPQVPSAQQANVQRHVQASTESLPLLYQHRQRLLHQCPTQQNVA
ncbi:hypothetical protein D9M71_635210 [compost metagenome]